MYLYPSYHIVNADGIGKPQRVYLIDGDWKELTKSYDYSVELFKCKKGFGNNLVSSVIKREEKKEISMTTKVFIANDEFDVMQVSNGFAIGMLVPKYDVVGSGTDSYEFAIDFGTTNTHVEYRVNNGQVTHPLEMSQLDSPILAMHSNDSRYQELFEQKEIDDFMNAPVQEFLPTTFGVDEMVGFPLRTNICLGKANAMEQGQDILTKVTLGDYSVGFHYERMANLHNNLLAELI